MVAMKQVIERAGILTLPLLLSCCATMVNGTTEQIPVKSDPPGAVVTIECGNAPLYGGLTPAVITLERKAQPCALTIAKEGYSDEKVVLIRTDSRATVANKVPGAVAGTLLGVLSYFLTADMHVDPDSVAQTAFDGGMAGGSAPGNAIDQHTGAAYKHVPGTVFVKLRAAVKEE